MKLLQKILWATDFRRSGNDARRTAIQLARVFQSEVIPIHVIEPVAAPLLPRAVRRKRARTLLAQAVIDLAEKGVRVGESISAEGSASEQIMNHADRLEANVILLGSGEKVQNDTASLGTTAERVIRGSAKPVWVTRRKQRGAVERILCPVDDSDAAKRALTNAIHLARNLPAKLTVLHATPRPTGLKQALQPDAARKRSEKLLAQDENRFAKLLKKFDFQDVTWKQVVRRGDVVKTILRTVHSDEIDLIVMGTVGRSNIVRVLMGSVTREVVRAMPCSIVTVKAEHVVRLSVDREIADMEMLCKQGLKLLSKGFAQEALTIFRSCVVRNVTYIAAWEGLAAAHARLGNEEELELARQQVEMLRRSFENSKIEAAVRREYLQGLRRGNRR